MQIYSVSFTVLSRWASGKEVGFAAYEQWNAHLWLFCVTTAGQKKGAGKLIHIVCILAIETNALILGENSKHHCLRKYLHFCQLHFRMGSSLGLLWNVHKPMTLHVCVKCRAKEKKYLCADISKREVKIYHYLCTRINIQTWREHLLSLQVSKVWAGIFWPWPKDCKTVIQRSIPLLTLM